MVKPGKVMKSLYEKRDNLRGLTDLFSQIASLQQMRLDMDVFVESTDYPGALQIAEDVRQALRQSDARPTWRASESFQSTSRRR